MSEQMLALAIAPTMYDKPEVLALPVAGGYSARLHWLAAQAGPEDQA